MLGKKTPSGKFTFFTMEDVEPVCGKCRQAFYHDYMSLDCEYCALPKILETLKTYAYLLEEERDNVS